MIKKNTAILGMLFALLGFQNFEVVYSMPGSENDPDHRWSAREHLRRIEEEKAMAKAEAERKAREGTRPCVDTRSCSDCYTLKLCATGWKDHNGDHPPGFNIGAHVYPCEYIPPRVVSIASLVPVTDPCITQYVHKGWDVTYGVKEGHAWPTKVFNQDTCILIGCHDRSKPCGTLTNVTERIIPGLNCTHTDPAAL